MKNEDWQKMYVGQMSTLEQKESTTGFILLGYVVVLVFFITLLPFRFQFSADFIFTWKFDLSGLVTNIVLFVPVGFLYRLSRGMPEEEDRFFTKELFFGLLLSFLIELLQGFIPGRVSSGFHVIANGTGAWAGAVLLDFLRRRIDKKQATELLALQYPLMNLVYLLIPLLWISSLAIGDETLRVILPALLGVFGSFLMLSVHCHGFKPEDRLSSDKFSALVLAWFFIAALPALLKYPFYILFIGIVIGITTRIPLQFPIPQKKESRRYELQTLKTLLPVYAAYLILLLLLPGTPDIDNLHAGYLAGGKSRFELIFRVLENLAAFPLLGYMTAEMRGRKHETPAHAAWWVLGISATISVVAHLIRSHFVFSVNMVVETALFTAAALYGAYIYRKQLEAIRGLNQTQKPVI
jgi:glycopeptide antibiotics resistance protein